MTEEASPSPESTPPRPTAPSPGGVSSTGLQESTAAGLSYVAGWVTGLIFFLMEKSSPYVRFHAAQSLVVFGALAVASMILAPMSLTFMSAVSLVTAGIWLYCVIMAFSGKAFRLPLAADFAEKLLASKPLEAAASVAAAPSAGPVAPAAGSKVGLILGIVAASCFILCGGAVVFFVIMFKMFSPVDVDEGGTTIKGPDGKVRIDAPSEEELKEMERPKPIRASMDDVKKLLPEKVGEWKRGDDYSVQKLGDQEESEVTHLSATYRKGDAAIELQLWGGAGVAIYAGAWIGMVQVEEKDRYIRKTAVSGFKGKEQVDRKARTAALWLRVGKFALLAEHGQAEGPEAVREFMGALDLSAIARTE